MTGPGWPSERQWVTLGIYALALIILVMGAIDKSLWQIELFKVIAQAVIISGLINMVLAFHFSANKSDETKSENTAKAFDAITATANATNPDPKPDVVLKPGETAQAEEAP